MCAIEEETVALSEGQQRVALRVLRSPSNIAEAAKDAGTTEELARAWITAYLAEKASLGAAKIQTGVVHGAEIVRDKRGVPHISADDQADLYFALGFAEAQDRLWQLDYLRRQAHGRLSEVFGAETLQADVLSKTLDITGIAAATLANLSDESREATEAFSAGVNAWMAALPAGLPIEFELLGYEPEPWTPVDSLAVLRRWWWYLTGRLNVLTTPEVVRAAVGSDSKYEAFFAPDGPVTYIVPSGNYDPTNPWPTRPMDPASSGWGSSSFPAGSNNWAAAPPVTTKGSALLASDPHVYFTVPAEWYEVHLHGAGYDASGVCYPAMPGILIGRNQHLAWGVTNNICSLRDLYVEEINPANDAGYRGGDSWMPFDERRDEIVVKGAEVYGHTTRMEHGRPIVDHLIPTPALPDNLWKESAQGKTALSLGWVGFEPSDEARCLIKVSRAATVDEAREAYRGWRCPTFNMVFADDQGSIGYQTVGALPLRGREKRGYRFAHEPLDAWQGTIPFDELPRLHNPERGWIASANNPTAPADFPYPLSGTWAPEDRAGRAEHLLTTQQPHSLDSFSGIQTDVHSGRAERGTKGLLRAVAELTSPEAIEARERLGDWDFRLATDSVAASVFYVFFWRWHQRVVGERFGAELMPLAVDSGWGLSSSLLHENLAEWFESDEHRVSGIQAAFGEALGWLDERFGSDLGGWTWGKLHRLGAIHPAAKTALQHEVLDVKLQPHAGGASTLASAFYLPAGTFDTRLGASYRLLADLGPGAESRAICWPGQSGHPGSAHYTDQVAAHLAGMYATTPLAWSDIESQVTSRTRLLATES